jgi:gas vesicle protein
MDNDIRSRDRFDSRHGGFITGLALGTVIGGCATLWLGPLIASAFRQQLEESTRTLRRRAAEQYEQASARVAATVDDVSTAARGVRDEVAGAVASAAREVERVATAAQSTTPR